MIFRRLAARLALLAALFVFVAGCGSDSKPPDVGKPSGENAPRPPGKKTKQPNALD